MCNIQPLTCQKPRLVCCWVCFLVCKKKLYANEVKKVRLYSIADCLLRITISKNHCCSTVPNNVSVYISIHWWETYVNVDRAQSIVKLKEHNHTGEQGVLFHFTRTFRQLSLRGYYVYSLMVFENSRKLYQHLDYPCYYK